MKKVKIVIGTLIIIAVAFLYAHIGKANPLYDRNVDSSEYIGTGVFEGTIEEVFVSSEETLDGIAAKLQLQGESSGTVIRMTLVDQETNTTVAKAELASEEIKNSKFNEFSFDTVENCKGKKYRVIFESDKEDVENSRGIGLLYQTETEEDTSLLINGEHTEGTLIIKTVTDRFDLETFCVFLLFVVYIVCFLKFLYKLFR